MSVIVARQKRPTTVLDQHHYVPEPESLQAIWKQSERGEQRCASWHPWKTQLQMRWTSVQSLSLNNELADAVFPGFVKPCFEETVGHTRDRFIKTPGLTKQACHQINTVVSSKSPTQEDTSTLPARSSRVDESYAEERESSSSWLAHAVYTRKKMEGI